MTKENAPAEEVPLRGEAPGFSFSKETTSANGAARLRVLREPGDFGFRNVALMTKDAFRSFVDLVTTAGRRAVAPSLAILPKRVRATVRTVAEGDAKTTVENARAQVTLRGYALDADAYLSRLVNQQVNSKVTTLTLKLRNYDTHVRIKNAEITMKSDAKSPRELLQPYLRGEILTRAVRLVKPYERGKKELENVGSDLTFRVLAGTTLSMKVTHPKHNFFSGAVTVSTAAPVSKTLYMSEVGKKVRVKMVDE